MKPTDTQIGGTHYKDMPIQPIDFITKNNIPYIEGNIIKYLCRWRSKNGVEDLKKAKHYLEMLIDIENPMFEISANPNSNFWYDEFSKVTPTAWKDLGRVDTRMEPKKMPPKKEAKKK